MRTLLDPAAGRHGRGLATHAVPLPGRRLLRAVEEALAAASVDALVVARVARRGRCLEVVCARPVDVVGLLAPLAAASGAELIVRYAAAADDPAVDAVLRRGGVIAAGRREPANEGGFAHSPA
jgi:hypothetical protein